MTTVIVTFSELDPSAAPRNQGTPLLSQAINHTWRCHCVTAQGVDESDRFPMAVWNSADQAFTARNARSIASFRFSGGLVDKHPVSWVKHALFSHPGRWFLLRRPQAIFECYRVTLEEALH